EGVFDHANEQFFFATHEGQTGFYVYTPLYISQGRVIFVNRGFVPYDMKDAKKRQDGQVTGEVEVSGLARGVISGKPSVLVPDNEPDKNIYYWKDLGAMADNAGIARRNIV